MCPNHVALWIYNNQCRPRRYRVAPPDPEVSIVDDGMLGPQSKRGVTDSARNTFGVILPAVNSNNSELDRKLLFQLPQLRKYVNAVDSPVGPEVEQGDFPAQVGEYQRPISCVDPVQIWRKLWRANTWSARKVAWHHPSANMLGLSK